jgi:hypothetical protein
MVFTALNGHESWSEGNLHQTEDRDNHIDDTNEQRADAARFN